jgi:DNA-binding transcriptional LysR family regulator
MEMHQVRYFLAVARMLNFTRAAEACNVAQPSLTRAIKQLEDELGGDLFRRERPHVLLTGLGERMLPLLQQCYDSAVGARALAKSINKGDVTTLKLAVSATVDLALLAPQLAELNRAFGGLELKLLRRDAAALVDLLKDGAADFAVASDLGEEWDRLDRWPLFEEEFRLLVPGNHPLAGKPVVEPQELKGHRFLLRPYCEHAEGCSTLLRENDVDVSRSHELTCDQDVVRLLEAGLGVTVAPQSLRCGESLARAQIGAVGLRRTVYLYAVAGRQRNATATTMMKLLRSADWSRYLN